jgi:hypothetical protein
MKQFVQRLWVLVPWEFSGGKKMDESVVVSLGEDDRPSG